jgi:hypothetical protein
VKNQTALLQGQHNGASPWTYDSAAFHGRERDRGHADGSAGVQCRCGPTPERYDVIAFGQDRDSVFATFIGADEQ